MSPTTVAFFGATGDCAGYCLANILAAGIDCRALARTPARLIASMKAKGVSGKLLEHHLTIIEGNVKNVEVVKRVLQTEDGEVVDKIISGIGGTQILFTWNPIRPFQLSDNYICQDAGATILSALQELKPVTKPMLINVSTTGIQPMGMPRDVPWLYVFLYPWIGHYMHEDKRVLQNKLAEHVRLPEGQRGISQFTNVKPSLLLDGEAKGMEAIRQGTDEKPAVGWSIRRADVGVWIAENLVKTDGKPEWRNKSVSLTY